MNTQTIRVSSDLIQEARIAASLNMRTIPAQVAYWAKLGKIAEENPDLPLDFIKNIIAAMHEKSIPFRR